MVKTVKKTAKKVAKKDRRVSKKRRIPPGSTIVTIRRKRK